MHLERIAAGEVPGAVALVIASKAGAGGLARARRRGIPAVAVPRVEHPDARGFNDAIHAVLEQHQVDLVALLGFLSPFETRGKFDGRAINVHPALIPAFCGKGFYGRRVHEAVLESGVKRTGATVHFVAQAPRLAQNSFLPKGASSWRVVSCSRDRSSADSVAPFFTSSFLPSLFITVLAFRVVHQGLVRRGLLLRRFQRLLPGRHVWTRFQTQEGPFELFELLPQVLHLLPGFFHRGQPIERSLNQSIQPLLDLVHAARDLLPAGAHQIVQELS